MSGTDIDASYMFAAISDVENEGAKYEWVKETNACLWTKKLGGKQSAWVEDAVQVHRYFENQKIRCS